MAASRVCVAGFTSFWSLFERALTRLSHKFQKRCEARQNKIRDGSVRMHVTKRIAVITPHRALVVLRFLLNAKAQTHRCCRILLTLY